MYILHRYDTTGKSGTAAHHCRSGYHPTVHGSDWDDLFPERVITTLLANEYHLHLKINLNSKPKCITFFNFQNQLFNRHYKIRCKIIQPT